MNFNKIEQELKLQGRKKNWLIKELNSYAMEYHRVKNQEKEIPLSWSVKIPQLLNVSIDRLT